MFASPLSAGPLSPRMMCGGAWEKAATEIKECGGDGTPRPRSRRLYYPALSPSRRSYYPALPRPKFPLPQAGTETLTTSTPPPRTGQRASRVRSQSPTRREWTTSMYLTRLQWECLWSWWTLRNQPWRISFENEVLTHSQELSACYREYGRRYPSQWARAARLGLS